MTKDTAHLKSIGLFEYVGLTHAAAERAARGLANGTYGTFEEAATKTRTFDAGATSSKWTPTRLAEAAILHGGPRLTENEQSLAENFRRLGLSPLAAVTAARGRSPAPSAGGHGQLVESFVAMGMSRAAAETAATGRGGASSKSTRTVMEVSESKTTGADDDPLGFDLARRIEAQTEAFRELREGKK